MASDEPAPKRSKKEEDKSAEKEKDSATDSRPKLKDSIGFDPNDCTLNVLPTLQGKVLMSLSDGGMQFLVAGARANVGLKAGRYMFEAKIIETLSPAEAPGNRGRVPSPKQMLRIGFSTSGSQLILGESEDGVCFDAEGSYTAEMKKTNVTGRFGKGQTMSVLLNLDEKSPNGHTLSLFHNGERVSDPMPLPEALKGKTLYPHVSYRNVTVHMNFGPQPTTALPFKCRMVGTAATSDVEVSKAMVPKDGKYEVMFPVAFPDEGTFDWVDTFLEKNPSYVELSDRKIVDWARKSGLSKPKVTGFKSSLDKPEFNYGLTAMDDLSVRRVLQAVAPLVPRNYLVMEVKENLTKTDREANVKRFCHPAYKKVASVVMGEPNDEYKKAVHSRILKEKKEKAEDEWKAKKEVKERKKAMEAKTKQIAEMRKKAEDAKKAAAAEALKKAQEEDAQKREAEGGEKAEETKEEETKMEETKEEDKEEVKEEEKKEEEDEEVEPPAVELTEEDKKTWFRARAGETDLTSQVMSSAFAKFSLPVDGEGFDEIRYEWQSGAKANEYLRTWVLEKKVTSKMEDLKPSDWFKGKHDNFLKSVKEWQEKQKPFVKKKEEAAKKGEDIDENKGDDTDLFSIDNICDAGNGEPLFVNFAFEDWALLSLRYELFLMAAAFKHDADDEERPGIHETNLVFYYSKYYHKQLTPKFYGKDNNKDLVEFVKDTVAFDKDTNVLGSELEPDMDSLNIFVKLTEESRRERQRRVDAGDETARLKFNPMLNQVTKPAAGAAAVGAKAGAAVVRPAYGAGAGVRPAYGAYGAGPQAMPFGGKGAWGKPSW